MMILSRLEQKLPKPLRSRSAAALVLVVAVLVGVFRIGGAKLKAYQTDVEQSFSTGMYSITADLNARLDAASNIVHLAAKVDGVDGDELEYIMNGISVINYAKTPSRKAELDRFLEDHVNALYDAVMPLADANTQDLLAGQLAEYNSRATIINNNDYNFDAKIFNEEAAKFPASLIGLAYGIEPLEYYE